MKCFKSTLQKQCVHNLQAKKLNFYNPGYRSEEISILTTYNGQKHLIRDVVKNRCGDNPVFGFPKTITTVDRYQVKIILILIHI